MQKVDEIICQYSNLEINTKELKDDTLLCDLGFDSLTKTELIIALEEAYNMEFSIEDLNPKCFLSVGSLREMMWHVVCST